MPIWSFDMALTLSPPWNELIIAVVSAVLGWFTGNYGPPNGRRKK